MCPTSSVPTKEVYDKRLQKGGINQHTIQVGSGAGVQVGCVIAASDL